MYFLSGLSLGIGAGVVPGPLLTLVITRTLAGGFRAGQRVAIAPLLTDAPIILISILLFRALPPWLETALTVVGGCFVIYMGIETLRSARNFRLVELTENTLPASADLWRGLLVNFFSPHPWLFWITVGGPTLLHAWQANVWHAVAFLFGFYGPLIGSKLLVAVGVAGGRRYLSDAWYRRLLVTSGLLLCLFGMLLPRVGGRNVDWKEVTQNDGIQQ